MTCSESQGSEDNLVGKPRAECLFLGQQNGELEAYSNAVWEGDKSLDDRCQLD